MSGPPGVSLAAGGTGLGPTLEARGLSRRFADRWALSGIDVNLAAGDCLVVFGPNGAGKTTLLRVLGGLLEPTHGDARVDGMALPGDAEVRSRVGYVSHHSMLYPALTALENVEFAARLQGLRSPRTMALAALTRLRVADRADTPIRMLSRGLQQRVSIARAFVHYPRIVLLDEPYTGLDAAGAVALSTALVELKAAGAALILVTHNIEEGLALATRVAVMHQGRFVRLDSRDDVDAARFAGQYRALVGADA